MNAYSFALDILKYVVSGVLIAYALFYFFKNYFENELNGKLNKIRLKETQIILPLRLQAHERLLLFVDRINPENMLIRLYEPSYNAKQMQQLIISEIRSEYQHNIAQQLYIDHQLWEMIRRLKDETIVMIDNAATGIGLENDATTFSRAILNHISKMENQPYQNLMQQINAQIQDLF